jgi:hypothetical protein
MRAYWIAFLLLATLAWGQAKPTQLPPRPPVGADDDDEKPQAAASQVAPDAPVLTIKGFCPDQAADATNKPAAACQTVVTRAQFEKLANAISPTMKPRVRRELANAYPRLLVMAHDAEQRGLDKSDRVAELERFSRLQILSQEMVRAIQQEAANLSDEVIEDYYRSNSASYERASFERILVPIRKQMDSSRQDPADKDKEKVGGDVLKAQQAEGEEAMTKEASELRVRAAAGEDFTRLQQAAYDAAGIKTTATAPELRKIRRSNFPATHLSAFDLKQGEVSQVISDASGHYIYKLDSKELMPLDEVKAEIKSALQSRNVQEAMRKIQESFTTEMNPEFFGANSMPQDGSRKASEAVQSK